uniref:Uncharacterized protein n=1 Tax=Spongospora subterranea TaxID=70186 RepID=A0A0H5REA5_9EUKA|eukprot:CRZ12580.1 hypothetical protein [Spongospora subterranea]
MGKLPVFGDYPMACSISVVHADQTGHTTTIGAHRLALVRFRDLLAGFFQFLLPPPAVGLFSGHERRRRDRVPFACPDGCVDHLGLLRDRTGCWQSIRSVRVNRNIKNPNSNIK